MYPWVAECLIATLAELAGAEWTEEMAAEWSDALTEIARLMLAGYEGRDAVPTAGAPTPA
jgi:hemoglobin-like flavoprotein